MRIISSFPRGDRLPVSEAGAQATSRLPSARTAMTMERGKATVDPSIPLDRAERTVLATSSGSNGPVIYRPTALSASQCDPAGRIWRIFVRTGFAPGAQAPQSTALGCRLDSGLT